MVDILVDDHNSSDHYAISCAFDGLWQKEQVHSSTSRSETVKLHWDRADLNVYQSALGQELSLIDLPTDMLLCDRGHCIMHTYGIDKYYNDIALCLSKASSISIPTSKTGFHKFWWSEQLDELKLATMEATDMWRYAGCPRSGPVNDNRLQCKYRYKLAIKEAIANARHEFNDELYDYLMKNDDKEFRKIWRKKFCYNSKKVTKVLNGKFGDAAICAEFSEHFKSVCQPNTPEICRIQSDI